MFYNPLLVARIVFVLGILNFILALVLFLFCRCIPAWNPTKSLMNNPTYKLFYKYHCQIWWVFWASVIVHVVFAVGKLGIPF